ncbi:Gfo/Idh/MocA family protein [Nonomuraea purpurea]|uniref:Gfo/Idh/MocA family protein n=1 Tax=Nonomuraea purpurea TaxID=1849276 RepID=A0ABV8GDK7_9ACTN
MPDDLKIAVIGGGYMARAHSVALAALPVYVDDLPFQPIREVICDATGDLAAEAARRFGYNRSSGDWRAVVEDPDVDVVDVVLPNDLHLEVVEAALAAGKHVTCEKPLANTAAECAHLLAAAEKAGVVHQTGLNWRLAPAVQQARRLIEDGTIGEIRDFRGFWLADFGADASSPMTWKYRKESAGSGSLGDTGSHVIDFARYLAGEFASVVGLSRIHVPERTPAGGGAPEPVDVEDDAAFLAEFTGGAYGYVQLTRSSPGRKNHCGFELHGSKGSVVFDWERMNELRVYDSRDAKDRQGFRTVLMGPAQPYGGQFWRVPGYQIGFGETKVLQFMELVRAIGGQGDVQTSFLDGLRAKQVEEAVEASIDTRAWTEVAR